jgi:hypothetical protein
MGERFHRGFTAAEKTELWDRWKRGESLKAIGRAFGKPSSSIYFLVAPHGGIRPAQRRRSRLALTLAEREVISRGVARYMSQLDTADRQTAAAEEPSETVLLTKTRLKEKLAKLEEEVKRLAAIEKTLLASPDKQISLTDPDCRSMATSGRGSGMVAYNVQSAVDITTI